MSTGQLRWLRSKGLAANRINILYSKDGSQFEVRTQQLSCPRSFVCVFLKILFPTVLQVPIPITVHRTPCPSQLAPNTASSPLLQHLHMYVRVFGMVWGLQLKVKNILHNSIATLNKKDGHSAPFSHSSIAIMVQPTHCSTTSTEAHGPASNGHRAHHVIVYASVRGSATLQTWSYLHSRLRHNTL
mmetsp:Transcript_8769/g.16660  ORF Transcript_8769/g.16660 Transcript_8769/m.16660 type:complete len:186 (-) Transcript_8769:822-1379(-)